MKRIVTGVISLLLFLHLGMAQSLTADITRQAAVNFWNTHRPETDKSITPDDAVLYTFTELPMLHVYAVGQDGFVILAAYGGVTPVMGYSFDSPAGEELNPEVAYWLRNLDRQVAQAAAAGYRDTAAESQWHRLLYAPVPDEPLSLDNVPALLQTRWDQGAPYNKLCPFDSNYHTRTVVGCVATAMAQIMKYWNHPSSGTGSHSYTPRSHSDYGEQSADFEGGTYIWEYMNDRYETMTTNSERSEWAVSLLSYHCGVAVDMMYGPSALGGSGAYSSCGYWTTSCADQAFHRYFKYSPDLVYRERNGSVWYEGAYRDTYYYSDSAWCAMLDAELALGHPMYYDGSDSTGGHAFVLDGSDNGRRYHFNWGWSGSYDGFYHINDVAPRYGGYGGNATYTFNRSQGVIFGIVPLEEHFDSVTIYDTICNSVSKYRFHEYEFPAVTNTLQAVWRDTVFTINLKVLNTRTLHINPNGGEGAEGEVTFCPVDGVVLPENTYTRRGYYYIGWGEKRANNDTIYQPGDTLHWRNSRVVYAQWRDSSTLAVTEANVNDGLFIYPQPTDGMLNIALDNDDEANITICDSYGRVVLQRRTLGGKAKISLERMPAGTYTVIVTARGTVYKRQIIKI